MDIVDLQTGLGELTTVEIAEEMSRLGPTDQAVLFRLLDKDRASQVFEYLDVAQQAELLDEFREGRSAELLLDLPDDDRAQLLGEMPAKVAARMMAGLRDRKNTVLVVDHNPAVIAAADHVIGMGPGQGSPVAGSRSPEHPPL